jgi:hypothetical protein
MGARRRPTIRLLRVGDVLRAREDPEVLCRVIELGQGIDGGGDVVEVFKAGTALERLSTAPIKKLLRINGVALRWDFERVGSLSGAVRSLSTFSHWDLGAFLLSDHVLMAAKGRKRPAPKKRPSRGQPWARVRRDDRAQQVFLRHDPPTTSCSRIERSTASGAWLAWVPSAWHNAHP